ncbi:DUF927 domain-containing protein [Methylocystis rosea]|uniref:DUF927 domain-containing protein n=1 Tax=Methylocystis rosea TaxID=173366 RepID=UPI0003A1278D|nr:DUF927 domain-containing protein [Methylocystis rosea]
MNGKSSRTSKLIKKVQRQASPKNIKGSVGSKAATAVARPRLALKAPAKRPVHSIPTSTTAIPLKGWSAIRLRDEAKGLLSIEFRFPDGEGGESRHEIPNSYTVSQMYRELRGFTTALPELPRTAIQFIERVIASAPAGFCVKAAKPGWKWRSADSEHSPSVFVTPHFTIPKSAPFRWSARSSSGLGRMCGTLEAWQDEVASFAKHSNYLTFGLCCAAAAPLARFANLPELAVFNLVGESSVGKTTVARAAMSAIASPDSIRGWDLKNRALEEAAAQHNDLLFVLNGAEKAPVRERALLIERIIHMLPEGTSTARSSVVQDSLPDERWSTIVLSTSNSKGAEMVPSSRGWDAQDAVRFIDIPVPSIGGGGIFDRLAKDSVNESSEYVNKLERNLLGAYGSFLPAWINYLLEKDRTVRLRYWSRFYLDRAQASPGIEERVARKFALIYAAGKIAVEAKLLPFGEVPVYDAVKTLHIRSKRFRTSSSRDLRKVLKDVANRLQSGDGLHEPSSEGRVVVDASRVLFGVRTVLDGTRVIGFRKEALEIQFGEASARAFVSWLLKMKLLPASDGGPVTTQLRVELSVGGKRTAKPRFLVVHEEQLLRAISKIQ